MALPGGCKVTQVAFVRFLDAIASPANPYQSCQSSPTLPILQILVNPADPTNPCQSGHAKLICPIIEPFYCVAIASTKLCELVQLKLTAEPSKVQYCTFAYIPILCHKGIYTLKLENGDVQIFIQIYLYKYFRMSYYRYITGVYKSYLPELNRTLRSSSVPRTVLPLDTSEF